MGTGILVCGLNGVGKSTLGKALAGKLGYHFIDSEDLFFPKTDPRNPYASQRTRQEAETRLLCAVREYENFVLATGKGDYAEAILPLYQYVILIEAPERVRLARVTARSRQRFGDRVLPGGDLYEQEAAFFRLVQSRSERDVEEWVRSLCRPIIRVDGTRPVEESLNGILGQIPR